MRKAEDRFTPSQVATRSQRIRWSNKKRETVVGYLFALPEIIGLLLFQVFSILFSLYLSFCDWNLVGGIDSIKFVGFANYAQLFEDHKFLLALKNNLIFTIVTVPIGMLIALIFAVIIHNKLFMKAYFKAAFFIPYISTQVAIAAVWGALFHPSEGPINGFLMSIGIDDPPKWLGSTDFVLTAIIIIMIWQAIGYKIIIYLAGLANIPDDVYEAADIDGASSMQRFFKITIPLLGPTTFFLTVTLVISSFKVFDIIAFLTKGGPNYASNVLVYYIYEEGFQNFRMGYASAISWVLFIVVAIFALVTSYVQRKQING